MRHSFRRALLWAAVFTTSAAAQDFNIDFSSDPANVPPATFTAAGQPGVWNGVNPLPAGPAIPLLDTSGVPTTATVSIPEYGSNLFTLNDPAFPADVNALLSDGYSAGDLPEFLDLKGLRPDTYDILMYGQVPTHSWETWFLQPGGQQICSGFGWSGHFSLGKTHVRARVFVPSGEIKVAWALPYFAPGDFGWFSGMQIDRVWKSKGGGTQGANGTPKLSMSGLLKPNTPVTLELQGGAPAAFSVVFISVSATSAPFLGGVLHAFPVTAQVFAFTDATGSLSGSTTLTGLPSATPLTFQVGIVDASVPVYGASLSNAVKGYVF